MCELLHLKVFSFRIYTDQAFIVVKLHLYWVIYPNACCHLENVWHWGVQSFNHSISMWNASENLPTFYAYTCMRCAIIIQATQIWITNEISVLSQQLYNSQRWKNVTSIGIFWNFWSQWYKKDCPFVYTLYITLYCVLSRLTQLGFIFSVKQCAPPPCPTLGSPECKKWRKIIENYRDRK